MDTIGTVITMAVSAQVGWQTKATVDRVREARARAQAPAIDDVSPKPLVGICGHPCPGITPNSETLYCTLPAKHEGWHHDLRTGADWSGAA